MKSLLLLLVLALFTSASFAGVIPPNAVKSASKTTIIKAVNDIDDRLDIVEALPAAQSYTSEGISNLRIARVTYSVAADGGTIGAHALGVTLPAKSMIIRSWFNTDVQFVDAGSGTVALSCEDANNIKTATDITGNAVGTIVEGASTGAMSAAVASIAAACEVTATVAGADQSAGKLTAYIMYVVTD